MQDFLPELASSQAARVPAIGGGIVRMKWKMQFRDDQIELIITLMEWTIDQQTSGVRGSSPSDLDKLSHRIAISRIRETLIEFKDLGVEIPS